MKKIRTWLNGIVSAWVVLLPALAWGFMSPVLSAEEAFQWELTSADSNHLTFDITIAPGTYLYQKQFAFESDDAQFGRAIYPPGEVLEDPFFGKVTVFRHHVQVQIPIILANINPIHVTAHYQGCNDQGFCYPPLEKLFDITLSASTHSPDNSALSILQHTATPIALALFFGFGILLALTPCVLPMVPILSALIIGEQHKHHRWHALRLAFTYVLFMALTYAALGAGLASLGANVQAQLQNPWALSITAGILLLMAILLLNDKLLHALSQLNLPLHRLSNGMSAGKTIGVAMMGIISALIVSPCVTPPLIGALTYITLSGDVILGASALFCLALGMGVPLIAFSFGGTALLPTRGPWLEWVKHIFAVILVVMAIELVARFLSASFVLVLYGALLVGLGFWLGPFKKPTRTFARLVRGLSWVALLYGTLLIIGGAQGNTNWQAPLSSHAAQVTSGSSLPFDKIYHVDELSQALEDAKAQGKPVMLDFYADWCTSCLHMEKTVFTQPAVTNKLMQITLLKADVTHYNDDARALMQAYGVYGPPALIFFDAEGQELPALRIDGDTNAPQLEETLQKLLQSSPKE